MPQEGIEADFKNIKVIPPINPFLVKKVINASGEKIPKEYQSVGPLIIMKKQKDLKRRDNYTVIQKELL